MEYNPYIEKLQSTYKDKYTEKAGIYSIKISGQIVYIGKSTNLLHRAASHMQHIYEYTRDSESNKYQVLKKALKQGMPVDIDILYYSTKTDPEEIKEDIGECEGLFIRYYKPPLNYQIPKEEDWRKYTINKEAQTITLEEIRACQKGKL